MKPSDGQIDDLLEEIKQRVDKDERVLVTTLTKRMAEELTDFLGNAGVRVRYLHSDVDTLKRVELLTELRQGVYDVLVGINLLREGLDLPEVSLVAILDADKEGFLRSSTSLIQTIGRAARNVSGQVLMYADKMTDSMKTAIEETDRRREKQVAYNLERGIDPQPLRKKIADITEVLQRENDDTKALLQGRPGADGRRSPTPNLKRGGIAGEGATQLEATIGDLNDQMLQAAAELKFELAARLRDEVQDLKKALRQMESAGHVSLKIAARSSSPGRARASGTTRPSSSPQSGHRVVLATRDRGRAAAAEQSIMRHVDGASLAHVHLDLADLDSVRAAADELAALEPDGVDAIVNNAGVVGASTPSTTAQGTELQIGTNHLGHFAWTALTMPLLEQRGGRVVHLEVDRTPVGQPRHGRPVPRRPLLQLPAVRPQQARGDAVRLRTCPAVGGCGLVRRQRGRAPRTVARRALAGAPGRRTVTPGTRVDPAGAASVRPGQGRRCRTPRARCGRRGRALGGVLGPGRVDAAARTRSRGPCRAARPRPDRRRSALDGQRASFRGRVRSRRTRLTTDSRADVGPLS
ncbi:SDR family NAD(P)-dependent oxidoreductase [Sphingomonas sp. LR61]|uniref:SDR family NAD(P)-dependent oxidoreductase n=1 Tax=Sphingomonas sp. LR61 TaxID=3050234 RepID=UPI002FE316A5